MLLSPDRNRSIIYLYQFCILVNGRLLYVVDWWMVVAEWGDVVHGVKREGKLSVGVLS